MGAAELSLDEINEILFDAEEGKRTKQIEELSAEIHHEQAIIDDLKRKQQSSNIQCDSDKRKVAILQAQRVRAEAAGPHIEPGVLAKVKRSINIMIDDAQSLLTKHNSEHLELTADIGRRCMLLGEKRQKVDALRDPNYVQEVTVQVSGTISSVLNLGRCRPVIQNMWTEVKGLIEDDGSVPEGQDTFDDYVLLTLEIFRGKMALAVNELGGINIYPEEKKAVKDINDTLKSHAMLYLGHIPESIQDQYKWRNGWKDYIAVKEEALNHLTGRIQTSSKSKQTLASVLPKELIAEEANV